MVEMSLYAGNKKHNGQAQNRQSDVKNSIGNGEAKEFIYTTHGHELSGWSSAGGCGGAGWRGIKGEKKTGKTVIP